MKERLSAKISRREFLRDVGIISSIIALLGLGIYRRKDIRQIIKNHLRKYPELYELAALLEERGLKIIGMPARVDLYPYSDAGQSESNISLSSDVGNVKNVQDAVDFFQQHPHIPLEETIFTDFSTGIQFLSLRLPATLSNNHHIMAVLGTEVTTPAGESLPNHAVALRVIVPDNLRAIIAPVVPIPGQTMENPLVNRYAPSDYANLNLPRFLISQTVISPGHEGSDRQIIPNAERIIIGQNDIRGVSFQSGDIAQGTVYLWADGEKWGLAEWPNPILQQPNTGCARMTWNINPYDNLSGRRIFRPYTDSFLGEQAAQLHGYLNHLVVQVPYEMIGPTAIFRLDQQTEEKDIVFVPPFLPLVAPHIMEDIVLGTPVGRNSEKSSEDDLIIVMPDAKYNTMYGFHPAMLIQTDGRIQGFFNTGDQSLPNQITDYLSRNNSLAFYLGKD